METKIAIALQESIYELYQTEIIIDNSSIQRTRKDIEGDFTIVVFPFLKISRKNPEKTAQEIGEKIKEKLPCSFNTIKGFLNISFTNTHWIDFLNHNKTNFQYGFSPLKDTPPIVIEYSSPNTNKPLHLGHIRNNLLGDSLGRILTATGEPIIRVNLVNDRGIHICKSMIAWKKFGHGETPESSGLKGDHLVGKYYVLFDTAYKKEINELIEQGIETDKANQNAPILKEAQEMLKKWEANDEETIFLWKKMNGWVYDGFEKTYHQLGINFDKTYYESDTYLLGKKLVEEGVKKNIFHQKEDGSIWANLTDEGLDEKLLLRQDGTSVYMTQDLGTAQLRYQDFTPKQMIYVVGNEQNYHFDVLKIILDKKLNFEVGKRIFHLSYGMVELPSGKMKSREGTVVDADDLMNDMISMAKQNGESLGKSDFSQEEAEKLHRTVGLGALKYFILKVDPKKSMLFNPEESIDLNGNTAPFIQYTYARIKSLLRKANEMQLDVATASPTNVSISNQEKDIIKSIYDFPQIIHNAAQNYNPALIANYLYEIAKSFNRFYQEIPILKENNQNIKILRVQIAQFLAVVLKNGMSLLGIDVPEKM